MLLRQASCMQSMSSADAPLAARKGRSVAVIGSRRRSRTTRRRSPRLGRRGSSASGGGPRGRLLVGTLLALAAPARRGPGGSEEPPWSRSCNRGSRSCSLVLLLSLGLLFGDGGAPVGAVETEMAVAEGDVGKGAVVWPLGVVDVGPEKGAGRAHPSYRDPALVLEDADHLRQAAQKNALLLEGEGLDRLEQYVRPARGALGFAAAGSRKRDRQRPASLLRDEAFLAERGH